MKQKKEKAMPGTVTGRCRVQRQFTGGKNNNPQSCYLVWFPPHDVHASTAAPDQCVRDENRLCEPRLYSCLLTHRIITILRVGRTHGLDGTLVKWASRVSLRQWWLPHGAGSVNWHSWSISLNHRHFFVYTLWSLFFFFFFTFSCPNGNFDHGKFGSLSP